MSGGEQQMVAIGRALMSAPEVLLLDEPSLGLSPLLAHELFDALVRIRAAGVGVLLVEQNARESLRIADRGYLLETGRIVGEGRADHLAADPAVREPISASPATRRWRRPTRSRSRRVAVGPLEADLVDAGTTLAVTPPKAGVHRERRSLVRAPVAAAVTDSGFRRNDGDEEGTSTTPIPAAPSPRGRRSEDRPMFHTRLIIADRDVGAGDSRTFDRLDPVTGEVATRAAAASIGDAQKAADAAAAAFPEWSKPARASGEDSS